MSGLIRCDVPVGAKICLDILKKSGKSQFSSSLMKRVLNMRNPKLAHILVDFAANWQKNVKKYSFWKYFLLLKFFHFCGPSGLRAGVPVSLLIFFITFLLMTWQCLSHLESVKLPQVWYLQSALVSSREGCSLLPYAGLPRNLTTSMLLYFLYWRLL